MNHVFGIIAQYYKSHGDWKETLNAAIPGRKIKSVEEEDKSDEDLESEKNELQAQDNEEE